MSVDLEKLAKQVDEVLAKETPESLTKWLNKRRQNANTGEKKFQAGRKIFNYDN